MSAPEEKMTEEDNREVNKVKSIISQLFAQLDIKPINGIVGMLELICYVNSRMTDTVEEYTRANKVIIDEFTKMYPRIYEHCQKEGEYVDKLAEMHPDGLKGLAKDTPSAVQVITVNSPDSLLDAIGQIIERSAEQVIPKNKLN